MGPSQHPGPRRELLVAGGLGLVAALVFFALRQERLPGDAAGLVAGLARASAGEGPLTFWYHLGYAWCVQALGVLGSPGGLDTRAQLELASALAAGLSLPLGYLALRRLELSTRAAGAAVLLLALSPALWVHGTIIEVHGFQLATGLAGLALVARARGLGLGGLAGVGLLAGLVVALGHQTGPLLFPGLVLASFWGAGERPAAGSAGGWALPGAGSGGGGALRFGASCAGFLVALFAVRALTAELSPFPGIQAFSDFAALTALLTKGSDWAFVRTELLAGLPLLLVAGLLGLATGRDRRALLGLALVAVPFGFFLVFGERTEGGYFLGASPGLLLLAALAFERRPPLTRPLPLGLVAAASLALALAHYAAPDAREANRRAGARAAEVAALLPDGGTLYALQYNEHSLAGSRPGLVEVNHCLDLREHVEAGGLPQDAAALALRRLERLAAEHPPVVVDWTWTEHTLHYQPDTWRPYLEAVRAALDERWTVTEHPGTWGTLLSLEAR